MNIDWSDWNVFLAVAETKSMSQAAKRLRLGQPTVSRKLQWLESELGYALFRRSVAGVALTAAGERLVEPTKKMAEWAGEVSRRALSGAAAPTGVVRVTAPPVVAWEMLAPFARFVQQKHPQLSLEVLTSHQYLDLSRGEADLALRPRPGTGDLTTIASVTHKNGIFISPRYGPLPKRPKLVQLRWVGWAAPYEDVPPMPQLKAAIPGFAPVFTSDSFIVQRHAVEAGVGALPLARLRSRHALPTTLRPLDVDLGPFATGEIHLVCAKSALDIPRVRAVAELLADELRRAEHL